MQAQSTHARPRRGLQTASEMARPVRLALWVLELSTTSRAHDDGTQVLCLKCFPETAQGSRKTEAAAQQPDTESTDSYDSSSSS